MRKIIKIIGCITVAVMLSACSNPEDDAKELSDAFNKELQKYSECEIPNEFNNLLYSAKSKIESGYNECEKKYQDTPEKIELFYSVYQQKTDSMIVEFNKAYAENIKKTLGSEYWYKPCISDGYYVYTFNDDKFHVVGCKEDIPYTINGDTLFFNDSDNSKLIIDFGYGVESFSLKDVTTRDAVTFVKADDRAKICGSWHESGAIDADFVIKNNGKYVITVFGYTSTCNWKYSKGMFTWCSGSKDALKIKDIDHFVCGNGYFSRRTKPSPKSVSFLFDEDNQVEDPVEKTKSSSSASSSSGSEDWDKILDEYEEFVNDYIKLFKKAQSGDMSAMTEYVSVLEDAQSLANKLEGASSDLSSSQLSRYQKILSKMTSAMN